MAIIVAKALAGIAVVVVAAATAAAAVAAAVASAVVVAAAVVLAPEADRRTYGDTYDHSHSFTTHLGEAEVDQLEVAALIKEKVLRLKITVHNTLLVKVLEGEAYLG